MEATRIHDRERIAAFLHRDAPRHIYAIGDLDDAYWPHTTWYAAISDDQIKPICLLYAGVLPPVLLGLSEPDDPAMRFPFAAVGAELPDRLYAHLSPGMIEALGAHHTVAWPEEHLKMHLEGRSAHDGQPLDRLLTVYHAKMNARIQGLAARRALLPPLWPRAGTRAAWRVGEARISSLGVGRTPAAGQPAP